jgi:WD40 repeat protein
MVLISGSVGEDRDVRVWERATGKARLLKGHTDTVTWVDFSPDGQLLASASLDHTVRVWDLGTGAARVLKGHGDRTSGVAFSPLGDVLVSTSIDRTTRVWNLASGSSRVIPGEAHINLAFSPDGRSLAVFDRLWDVGSGEERRLTPSDWVGHPAFSPRGGLIAARTATGGLRLWKDDAPHDPSGLRQWLDEVTDYKVSFGEAGGR